MAALGWLINLGFAGSGNVNISVPAPDIYAHWDVDILMMANFTSDTELKVNYDVSVNVLPTIKGEIIG